MEKIKVITDSNFRSGTNKLGKPYQMMKVDTDQHSNVTVFAPAAEGDPVTVTESQYGLQGKVMKNAQYAAPKSDGHEAASNTALLLKMDMKLDELLEMQKELTKDRDPDLTDVEL